MQTRTKEKEYQTAQTLTTKYKGTLWQKVDTTTYRRKHILTLNHKYS